MEVVPTNDGDDDDGVIWYRCPQCQGFLPKLKDAADEEVPPSGISSPSEVADTPQDDTDDNLPWDSPAAMMKDLEDKAEETPTNAESDDDVLVGVTFDPLVESVVSDVELKTPDVVEEISEPKKLDSKTKPKEDPEPIMEYAAMLAEIGVAEAVPYRPWQSYKVGQCINHLAWNDCGVVVAKEALPGGRNIIKCYFEEAGVVRLIEEAPR